MPPSVLLPAAFFLSGAAGLIFQVVWFHRAALVFGSSLVSVTAVLSSFMGGLAAGNALAATAGRRIKRPLVTYVLLELSVALSGVLVTAILPRVAGIMSPTALAVGESRLLLDVVRFVVAFAILAVPATSMGATLPVIVTALCRQGGRFGEALGRLYGWNTLGAVAGVIGTEIVLVGSVGVFRSAWVAAALNVGAAVLAASLARHEVEAVEPSVAVARVRTEERGGAVADIEPTRVASLLAATAIAGALLLALEVVWFRLLTMYVLATTLAVSLMLAAVLAGIGLGGLAASMWIRRVSDSSSAIPLVACAAGAAVVASFAAFGRLTSGTQVGGWTEVLWFAGVLTFPVSLLSGVLFTLIGEAVSRRITVATRAAAWLALANTSGALAGAPIAAFLLLPTIGMSGAFFALALAYSVVAWQTASPALSGAERRWRTPRLAGAAVLGLAIALFPFGATEAYFGRAAAAYGDDGSVVVGTREGPAETLFVMQQRWLGQPVYSRLITNGFSMSGTALQGQRYMRAFAYYPMLLHDGPLRRVLVVCYGVGVTVSAVTDVPGVESIDVAEISRDTVAMSDVIYPEGRRPLDDPRVRLHIEDGRFFLQSTRERYDLITGEPPPPRTPGAVNIYTREYFRLLKDHLADGGLATYWVPVARPRPGTNVNSIIRAFCEVFDDCSLWNATPFDLMLVGSRGGVGRRSDAEWSAPWQTPGLEARLREVGFERPEQIGATFVGDADRLLELTRNAPALTDDFPQRLHPTAASPSLSDPGYGTDAQVTRLYQETLDPVRTRDAFGTSPWIRATWPADLLQRTLPYFDQQAIINRVYWEGGRPLRQIADLHALLTGTTLRTLPLWVLGSDDVKQQIAERSGDASGAVEYARGLRALSGRDYAGAVRWLDAAAQRGLEADTIPSLTAYALAMSGQVEAARARLSAVRPSGEDARRFREWFDSLDPGA